MTKKIKLSKKQKILAVFSVFIIVMLAVVLFYPGLSSRIVRFYRNHINNEVSDRVISMQEYSVANGSIKSELQKNNISPVTLPSSLSEKPCSIDNIKVTEKKQIITSDIECTVDNIKMNITVHQYEYPHYIEDENLMIPKSSEKLTANGLDVYVYEAQNGYNISYTDNLTTYRITAECDKAAAVDIAKTLTTN